MRGHFQSMVTEWLYKCFGAAVAQDKMERNYRFIEEALELVQSCGMTQDDAIAVVKYVYSRKIGAKQQEVGGTMITLAALCGQQNIDMMGEAWREYDRIFRY